MIKADLYFNMYQIYSGTPIQKGLGVMTAGEGEHMRKLCFFLLQHHVRRKNLEEHFKIGTHMKKPRVCCFCFLPPFLPQVFSSFCSL